MIYHEFNVLQSSPSCPSESLRPLQRTGHKTAQRIQRQRVGMLGGSRFVMTVSSHDLPRQEYPQAVNQFDVQNPEDRQLVRLLPVPV